MPAQQENYNQAGTEVGYEGTPHTSKPLVLSQTDGSVIYYYDCRPEDFVGRLRWPWILAAVCAFFLPFTTLVPWVSVNILGGQTSANSFGTISGATLKDLQPTSFNQQELITRLVREDVSAFGILSFTGWILLVAVLVAFAFSMTGLFTRQYWPCFVVAGAGGLALAWSVFQIINISNAMSTLQKIQQVIDANGTTSADIVIRGGVAFIPWVTLIFAAGILFSGIFYAIRGR